jgi:AcrR family transcriptional regulator
LNNEEAKKMTKRSIDAQKTKEKIYNVSLNLFSKRGYNQVTVEQISKYAGVAKGSFYTHFQSKESVLIELFHRIDAHYIEVFKHVDKNETALNKLRIFINTMCNYCNDVCGIDTMRIIYANQINNSPHIKILNNYDRSFYYFIHDFVREGQMNGEFRTDIKEKDLVDLIARHCRSILYEWCLYGDEFDLIEDGKFYTETILVTAITNK